MNHNKTQTRTRRLVRQAFSLIELVIVVVIIAIIGAIALPKMSRGAAGAGDSALKQDLSVLRSALDLYQAENGGNYPASVDVYNALTGYNDGSGHIVLTKDAEHPYGPYLRAVPPCPVGATAKGQIGIVGTDGQAATQGTTAGTAGGAGWLYNPNTGQINANTANTEYDSTGKTPWSQY